MTSGYVIGIILGLYFKIGIVLFFIFSSVLYGILYQSNHIKRIDKDMIFKRIRRYLKIFFPFMSFIVFEVFLLYGGLRISILEYRYQNLYEGLEKIDAIGIVDSEIKKGEYKNSFELKVESINGNNKFKGTKLIVRTNQYDLEYGDIVKLTGEFSKIQGYKNQGVFQYSEYCKAFNIYGNVSESKIEILGKKKTIFYLSYKIRETITNKIYQYIQNDEASLLNGILVGNTNDISDEIIENFQISSISHVLAVSGAHISCLVIGINLLTKFLLKSIQLKRIITIIFLLLFNFLIGFMPSAVRAVIMTSLVITSKIIHRKSHIYLNFIISILFILLYNPYFITNAGFLLSYFATFGIVYMNEKFRTKINIKNIVLKYTVDTILISVYANLFILPIMAYLFNQISLSFFIINFLITPIILIIEIFGVLFLFLPDFLSQFLGIILDFFLRILIILSEFGTKIPLSKILISSPNIIEILLYYIFVFYFTSRKKYKNYLKYMIVFLLLIVIIINCVPIFFKDFNIYFVDVGQGDSTLIKTTQEKVIMIDGGGSDSYDIGDNVLLPYILNKRIMKVDFMIISHFDSDHVKGLFSIMENVKVKNIIISKQYEITENFKLFEEIVNRKKIQVHIVQKGDEIQVDKDTKIQILWPTYSQISENAINNNSIVAKVIYKDVSILFTGDIEEVAEKEIIKNIGEEQLKSTILKVPHHGSKTSTSEAFLKKVNPKIALIGVGLNNSFGHPSNIILKRLEDIFCKVYRTDLMGEVHLKIKKNGKININFFNK